MLSFTEIINYLVKNKTKIVDDIHQYIQDELIESEHVSLSIQITTDDRIYHLVSSESDGGPLGLFLNLIDIWVSDEPYEMTKDDIEAKINHTIKHLRQRITTNPHL